MSDETEHDYNEPVERDADDASEVPEAEAERERDAGREDSPGGTVSHHGLVLDEIRENARGRDARNLDDEYLVFENDGDDRIDLSGWTVSNEAGDEYTFPEGFTLGPGEQVTLHSGHGRDEGGDLYWEATDPVWDNQGDVVTVRDAAGRTVLDYAY